MPERLPPMDNNDKPIEPELEIDSGSEFLLDNDQQWLMVDATTPGGEDGDHSDAETVRESVKARSQVSLVWRRFRQHKLAIASLVVLVLIILFAFVGAAIWHYGPTTISDDFSSPPSAKHPFGTDNNGYDTLAQVMEATQLSLKIAFTVAIGATVFGSLWGAIAGYYRGLSDSLMMRFVDLVLTIPALAVGALLGKKFGNISWAVLAAVLAGLFWAAVSRVVRGQVLSIREKEYVEAARSLGAGPWRIMFIDILPNVIAPIIVYTSLLIPVTIVAEASLSFLGVGIPPPTADWGQMIADSQSVYQYGAWWYLVFPSLALLITTLAFNIFGDGVRDAFDPRGDQLFV